MPDMNALKRAIVMNLKTDDEPTVGLHTFDDLLEISVRGSARRNEDCLVRPTCTIPLLEVLALLSMQSRITGPKITAAIRKAAKDAAKDPKERGLGDFIETTKAAMRRVQDEIVDKMEMVPRKGAFTGPVDVTILTVSPMAEAMQELGARAG